MSSDGSKLNPQEDRRLIKVEFDRLQRLSGRTFTVDACANPSGDNALCTRFFSANNSFLKQDLGNEFLWINPPFSRAFDFLTHYFAQKRQNPQKVGACIMLPHWR